MKGRNASSLERQKQLREELEKNPFLSDEQLAGLLHISIHTVRSDRRQAGIPEVRRRGGEFAASLFANARTLSRQEIVGELLEIEIDSEGLSLLDTAPGMGLKKSGMIRGHILFAQANTLANAVVDAEVALTAAAEVKYLAPVRAGERILAKARVVQRQRRRREVHVLMKTKERIVFEGRFTIVCLTEKLAAHFRGDAPKEEQK